MSPHTRPRLPETHRASVPASLLSLFDGVGLLLERIREEGMLDIVCDAEQIAALAYHYWAASEEIGGPTESQQRS